MSPPITPPPVTKTGYGGDGWSIVQVDLQQAAELLTDFSRSYDELHRTADFSCNPLLDTPHPQGMLGMCLCGQVRLLCHFIEKKVGHAQITSIATPLGEFEAASALFRKIKSTHGLSVDVGALASQPRWALTYQHYRDEE